MLPSLDRPQWAASKVNMTKKTEAPYFEPMWTPFMGAITCWLHHNSPPLRTRRGSLENTENVITNSEVCSHNKDEQLPFPSAKWSRLNWSSPFFQGSDDAEHPRLISGIVPENQGDSLSPVGSFPTCFTTRIRHWVGHRFVPVFLEVFTEKPKRFGLTATHWCLCFTDTFGSAEPPGQTKTLHLVCWQQQSCGKSPSIIFF